MKIDIFCVNLEDGKIFIHYDSQTCNGSMRPISDILLRCELLNKFTRKYKPLDAFLISSVDQYDEYRVDNSIYPYMNTGEYNLPDLANDLTAKGLLQIDVTVKEYMLIHGIDNVRGGTFSDEILDDSLIQTLEKEFKIIRGGYLENINLLNNIQTINELLEKNDLIENKHEYVQSLYNKYLHIKEKHNELKYFKIGNNTYEIGNHVLMDIKWIKKFILDLQNNISSNRDNMMVVLQRYNNENFSKYESLKIYLRHLVEMTRKYYSETCNCDVLYDVKFSNPEFIFDKFIYHHLNTLDKNSTDLHLDYYNTTSLELCDEFEGLYNQIMNRIQEYEFDLSTYSKFFELEGEIIIYYFQKDIK
jgi:hypothetical protein